MTVPGTTNRIGMDGTTKVADGGPRGAGALGMMIIEDGTTEDGIILLPGRALLPVQLAEGSMMSNYAISMWLTLRQRRP